MQAEHPEFILASASGARASILASAGIRFHQRPSMLDEAAELAAFGASVAPQEIALHLARKKAIAVAGMEPGAVVIGADQVLALNDEVLPKPENEKGARQQLLRLRGRTHKLYSAAVVVYAGAAAPFVDSASLTMRDFSDDFLDWYLETAGESVLTSVGAYHLEGLGIHLFSKIEGDYFTILGLPIFLLLEELRRFDVMLK